MNIFYLHHNTRKCARYHVDRHVVKMILETMQILCSAIWVSIENGNNEPVPPLRLTHKNHPSCVWARANKSNWIWLKKLGKSLCKEYTRRYSKTDKAGNVLIKIHKLEAPLRALCVPNIPDGEFTQPTQAMPDEYKNESSLVAYRNYYIKGKKHLHSWKDGRHAWKTRDIPFFIKDTKE
jgi:hypothetical protein